MFTAKLEKTEVKVTFQHQHYKRTRPLMVGNRIYYTKGCTICQILTHDPALDVDVVVSRGEAHCSLLDKFNEIVGEKHALTNALLAKQNKNRIFSKADRTVVWELYFKYLQDAQAAEYFSHLDVPQQFIIKILPDIRNIIDDTWSECESRILDAWEKEPAQAKSRYRWVI